MHKKCQIAHSPGLASYFHSVNWTSSYFHTSYYLKWYHLTIIPHVWFLASWNRLSHEEAIGWVAAFHSTSVKTWHTKMAPLWLPRTAGKLDYAVILGIQICFLLTHWVRKHIEIHHPQVKKNKISYFPNIAELKIGPLYFPISVAMKMLHLQLHHETAEDFALGKRD